MHKISIKASQFTWICKLEEYIYLNLENASYGVKIFIRILLVKALQTMQRFSGKNII